MTMNIVWKIGVNSHARRLTGSAPGVAGVSGGAGVAEAPPGPVAPGTHATTRGMIPKITSAGRIRRRPGERVTGRTASLADRVIPTGVPWVTSGDPPGPHPAPLQQAILQDGLLRVVRTRRLEAARRREPREDDPVELYRPDPDLLHGTDPPSTPPRTSVRCNAPTTASWSASTMPGRAMMRTSQPGWNEGAITLSASRSRRRTRFRTTALPNRRPVEIPKRVAERSVRRNRAESRGWDLVVPFSWIAAKSCGRESITSRGERMPRSVVRRSAASGPELAVQPGSGVPQSSSCGRESRAPWHDGASWAGTSASSGGPAILSIRPRGRSLRLPLEARKRARRPAGHMARRRPADDRAAPEWVSNVRKGRVGPAPGGRRHASSGRRSACETAGRGRTPGSHGYPRGVCAKRLATPSWPVLSSAGPRRRRRSRETPAASWRGAAAVVRPRRMDVERPPPRHAPRRGTLAAATSSTVYPERRSYRTNGREAGLASRPG